MKKYYLSKLDEAEIKAIFLRKSVDFEAAISIVKEIQNAVIERGDSALKEYGMKFDKVEIANFAVTSEEIEAACMLIPKDVQNAFEVASRNIEAFQRWSSPYLFEEPEEEGVYTMKGVKCFSQWRAIEKVGLYIPGGSAPLPSTVLMLGIPAKLAGCKEIVLVTPPGQDGKIPDIILYAAKLVGIDSIYKIGGAQAIFAMAYGTETIPKVDKIFGPGNQYVTAAKMLASIDSKGCAIDMPAGPSEVMVIADKYARPDFVAADLLSQAEHGVDSQVICICTNKKLAAAILDEIEVQLQYLGRKEIAKEALNGSCVIVLDDLKEDESLKVVRAVALANEYAPEHLILNVADPEKYVNQIDNAGSVFLGQYSCESAGDYASGPNHTLPTSGYAKAYSGLSVESFMKRISFQELNKEGIANLGAVVEVMAEVEGLDAHKKAMSLRRT